MEGVRYSQIDDKIIVPESLIEKRIKATEKAEKDAERRRLEDQLKEVKNKKITETKCAEILSYFYEYAIKLCEKHYIETETLKSEWIFDGFFRESVVRFYNYTRNKRHSWGTHNEFVFPDRDMLLKTQVTHPYAKIQFMHACGRIVNNQRWLCFTCGCGERETNLMRIIVNLPNDCLIQGELTANCTSK